MSATEFSEGVILTPRQMTEYAMSHKIRNSWGVMDEYEIEQTISFVADYWRLERIDLSEFSLIADSKYRNHSKKAHPIVHYFNCDKHGRPRCAILDGLHRIGMARARGQTSILAWVGYDDPVLTK